MGKSDNYPTEREWLLMEAVWEAGERESGLTSSEIWQRAGGEAVMTSRTARVLLNHLCNKGLLGYTVDADDSRVYHYTALRTREACRREKSRDFVNAYFRGSGAGAAAAFLEHLDFSDEELRELEAILEGRKGDERK